ncbi:MAG: hypothetical protein ACXVBW_00290, partial [Bdellovibrionota bacterium]
MRLKKRQPSQRRAWIIASALSVFLTLVVAEVYCRRISTLQNFDRWFHPYVSTGDFKGLSRAEAPEAFGYERNGLIYTYGYPKPISGLAEEAEYLFDGLAARTKPDPKRRRKRIFILGGSVALGDGAEKDENRWRYLLQNKLRQRLHSDEIDVVPAAVRAFVTTQERLTLELFVLPLEPDAVIATDGYNDLNTLNFGARPGDPFNEGVIQARYDSAVFQALRALSDRSALVRFFLWKSVYRRVGDQRQRIMSDPRLAENYFSSVAAIYSDNVRRMARRCHQENVPCYFLFQPHLEMTAHYAQPGSPMVPNTTAAFRTLSAVKSGGRFPEGTEFRDLTHMLDGHDDYYVDSVHFDDRGQE